jgi:hypothetical protein
LIWLFSLHASDEVHLDSFVVYHPSLESQFSVWKPQEQVLPESQVPE